MSCDRCHMEFIDDNLSAMIAIATRINNVLHCSENSQDVSDAQKKNVKELTDVRDKWKAHSCEHGDILEVPKVIEELPLVTSPESIGIVPKKRGRPPGSGRSVTADPVSGRHDD